MLITKGPEAVGAGSTSAYMGSYEACYLFAGVRPLVPGVQCPQRPTGESVVRLSKTAVAFEDPPRVKGTGNPSGGPLPANGVVVYKARPGRSAAGTPDTTGFLFEETCVLPASEHTLCTALLNDSLTRAPE
jgi:hypothetical protein